MTNLKSDSWAWLTRSDGSAIIGYGPFTSADAPPKSGVAFYKAPFHGHASHPWQIPSKHQKVSSADLRELFPSSASLDIEWQAPDAIPFSCVFEQIVAQIREGQLEKTVPVVTENGLSTAEPARFLSGAMASQVLPLQSYAWASDRSGFAGATPELLFSLNGKTLSTMALAGTARREDEDVFGVDEKEIREHEYVAETLVGKLDGLGQLSRNPRRILRLGSIVHFQTKISVQLSASLSPETLIKRLHPTPALGSLPRSPATLDRLHAWRETLRCPSEFGAPFGIWEDGQFEAIVAIRGIWWQGRNVFLPTGCGVIEPSRLVNEWRELRLKRQAIKNYLLI